MAVCYVISPADSAPPEEVRAPARFDMLFMTVFYRESDIENVEMITKERTSCRSRRAGRRERTYTIMWMQVG